VRLPTLRLETPARRRRWRPALAVALAAATGAIAAAPAAAVHAPSRIALIYDNNRDGSTTAVLRGEGGVPGLSFQRGAHRMEPSVNHVLGGDADRVHRVTRVSEGELLGRSAEEMAALLKLHIDSGCIPENGCTSHIVGVDEIGNHFSDRRGDKGAALDGDP